MEELIEISYSVIGYDKVGETSFEMGVSGSTYRKLQDALDEGEPLDLDYISTEMVKLHRRIIRAIRKNMEEEALFNPNDGMVEHRMPWGSPYKEFDYEASHDSMQLCDDDDIEYEVYLV